MRNASTPDPGADSPGVALPFVLLLLLALTGLAHGGLALSRGGAVLARARSARLRAGLLAEGALRVAEAELYGLDRKRLPPPGEARSWAGLSPAPGLETRIVHRRLGPEWHLLEAAATARTPWGRAREGTARVAWILDPLARIARVRAALEHGGRLVTGEGSVLDGSSFSEPPKGSPAGACAPYRSAIDAAVVGGGVREAEPLPVGPDATAAPAGSPDAYARTPGIGLLSGSALAALVEGGGGTGGTAVSGGLTLEGVERDGILVVAGDLSLRDGSSLGGVVLVGGDLELAQGSRILGWARVRGGVRLGRGTRIRGSGCAVGLALDRAFPRATPVFPPGGIWSVVR